MHVSRKYWCTSCGLLVTGVKESNCTKPCRRTKVSSDSIYQKHLHSKRNKHYNLFLDHRKISWWNTLQNSQI